MPAAPMNAAYPPNGLGTMSSNVSRELIPPEFRAYFQKLTQLPQGKGQNTTVFCSIMFVRMITEICHQLGIPCIVGVAPDRKMQVGNQFISVGDIVEEFKVPAGDGTDRPYRTLRTFQNYRGWVNNASTLLSQMETEGNPYSPLERRFLKSAQDLLRKPLHEAISLHPSEYGTLVDFNSVVNKLEKLRSHTKTPTVSIIHSLGQT